MAVLNKGNKIDKNNPNVCYFSAPLPFDTDVIDNIVSVNKKLKKSKISCFYNNMPLPFADRFNEWIMIGRGTNENIRTYDDFAKYAEYAQNKGFDVCYLMNSPKPFSYNDFLSFEKDFHEMLDMLKKYNIDYVKFSNVQIAYLLKQFAPEFRLISSSTTEYHSISQYRYLSSEFPNIEAINISYSQNHNFKLLKNLRQEFPDVKIEIMINQTCLKDCPARITHVGSFYNNPFNCKKIIRSDAALSISKTAQIFPWWVDEYLKLGINHFKYITAYDFSGRADFKVIYPIINYMYCIENGIEGLSVNEMFRSIFATTALNLKFPEHILLTELKKVLPDIKYFVKNGHKCSYACGIDCRYCYDCADKLRKFIAENDGQITM